MSLVIDLIGQLNCHVIGCKNSLTVMLLAVKLVIVDWCVSIRLLFRSDYR